jgi:hypothetical protein
MKDLNTVNAAYTNPWASNVFVLNSDLQSYSTCSWKTPCYKQFATTYNWVSCSNGCSPTAIWILYWYYDKNWFPNLLFWTAPVTNTTITNDMMNSVSSYIWTYCKGISWATPPANILNAKKYAISKWYANTTSSYSWIIPTSSIFTSVKTEINAWRPIIINIQNTVISEAHTVVWFWYRNVTTTKVVRMNLWWGGTSKADVGSLYYTSNIDQNLDAIYYGWDSNKVASSVVKFTIKL